jgi:hypothetical protein
VAQRTPDAETLPPEGGVDGPWSRVRRAVLVHLGSEDVAHVIYGSIIGLALVQALKGHPPAPGVLALSLIGTAIAVGLAEAYSELVAAEARTRLPVHRDRVRHVAAEAGAVVFGAAFPAVFFLLAAIGVMEVRTAFRFATWTGLALIVGYGYLGARLSGSTVAGALLKSLAIGVVGGIVIALKALLH